MTRRQTMRATKQKYGVNRREFLGALGAGAIAPAILGFSPPARATSLEDALEKLLKGRHVIRSDRFGRLFPNLPGFATASPALEAALRELGKKGGMMDAKDPLEEGPIRLITEVGQTDPAVGDAPAVVHPNFSANNRNNPTHTAGTTFLGQFIDHDFTFDLTSRLFVPVDPEASPNTRTPALDLDSVYGGGPDRNPELYQDRRHHKDHDRKNHRKDHDRRHEHHISRKDEVGPRLKIGFGGKFEDLPRMASNTAIIGDPRNDENIMLAGIHAAIILFHNNVVDLLEKQNRRDSPDEIFRKARRIVTWHYQWIVVHEFLPLIIGPDRVKTLLANPKAAFPSPVPFMPVEFQGAAYRMGHSMVRPSYRANFNGDPGGNPDTGAPQFFGMIFDPAGEGQADPVDLRGTGTRAPRRFIGWQTFFDFEVDTALAATAKIVRPNKRLDTTISSALFLLPTATIAGFQPDQPTSLPQRNLLRQVTWSMPSGQAIAAAIGATSLTTGDLKDIGTLGSNLDTSTPLWFYILREADVQHQGLMLGDVGSNIVGRVFIGLLQLDRNSFLANEPNWTPTLPDRTGKVTGNFTMIDLLNFADVVDRGPGSPGGTE